MDGQTEIRGGCAHFDREHAFGNEFACSRSHNADTQNALGFRIDDEFRHAFGPIDRNSAAGSCPRILCNFVFAALILRLGFSEASPRDFRISKDDGWNRVWLKGDFVSSDGFGGCPTLVSGFMREHRFADHVADGKDSRIVSLQLLVYLDKSALIDFYLGLVETGVQVVDAGVGRVRLVLSL